MRWRQAETLRESIIQRSLTCFRDSTEIADSKNILRLVIDRGKRRLQHSGPFTIAEDLCLRRRIVHTPEQGMQQVFLLADRPGRSQVIEGSRDRIIKNRLQHSSEHISLVMIETDN